MEETLKARWKESLVASKPTTSLVNTDDLPAITASMSTEASIDNFAGADDASQGDASLSGSEDVPEDSTGDESFNEGWVDQLENGEGDDNQLNATSFSGFIMWGKKRFG